MTNVWDGKHLWIWYISQTEGGNASAMISRAKQLGLSGVLIKAWDGNREWGQFKWNVQLFKSHGFKVGAWGYCYGDDVQGEAQQALNAAEYGADWIVINAESEYEGKRSQATQFGQLLRAKAPHIPIGLCSFAITYYHNTFPYTEFSQFIDVMLPQDYWNETGWPVRTETSTAMSLNKAFGRPVAPVGGAYGSATASDLITFVKEAIQDGATGVSFWSWQAANAAQLQAIGEAPDPKASQAPSSGSTGSSGSGGTGSGGSGTTGGTTGPSTSGSGGTTTGTGTPGTPAGSGTTPVNKPLPDDVPPDAWYAQAVAYVTSKGYMTAPGNKFDPQETVTRAMLAEVLYNVGRGQS